jgi:hypothetical protein
MTMLAVQMDRTADATRCDFGTLNVMFTMLDSRSIDMGRDAMTQPMR